MAAEQGIPVALDAGAHQLNLRELQGQALTSLYAATYVAGLGLLVMAIQFPGIWRAGVVGLLLQLVPYPAAHLLAHRYRARAWVLVGVWLVAAVSAVLWLPGSPAPALFALPVGLAAALLSVPAGVAVALGASLAMLVAPTGSQVLHWGVAGGVVWGVLALVWLSLRPMQAATRWSWQQYDQVRLERDRARDSQADLKQAVKDLAEASAQSLRLNQLLGAARRAAEAAERAKAEFVANVSHELRTPLNMIVGYSEMMLGSTASYGHIPAALRADLAVILRNSQHLAELIDDVLDLSQIEAGQMALAREHAVLHDIVAAAVEAMRPLLETKGLSLSVAVPKDLVVYCDRTRIREVVLNLVSNAARFTEHGGVRVRAQAGEREVEVSVADTGPGIRLEDQARLFQPFQQVDGSIRRRFGGTGLGLAISKHFVELHGGRMWLESGAGTGTTIRFRLPLEPPATADGAFRTWLSPEWEYRQRTRPRLAPAPALKPRLVVVERGNTLRRLLRRYLANAEVTPVTSLQEAAAELARVPAQALLVNDLSVGQALERIRESSTLPYGTPAIVCALPGEREAADALGVEGYLVKPVSRQALLASLDRLGLERGTILIVDDEPEAIRLFWRMLMGEERRYRVLTATNGQQALSILREQRPDAVLLDLVMPAMDGFQLLATRKDEPAWRDIPVIVISARDPAGQPIVSSAVGITRGGGLTVPQLLAHVESVCGKIADSGQPEHPAPPEAPPG